MQNFIVTQIARCLTFGGHKVKKGLYKVKQIPIIPKQLDIAHPPTHPPPIQTFFFRNPSLTWTEHSNNNNQQLLAMYTDRIHMVYYSKISVHCTGLGLFWDDFPKKKIQIETWTQPPTSKVISVFFNFSKLLSKNLYYYNKLRKN